MTTSVSCYQNNYDYLADALRQLDLLIQRRVMAFRLSMQARQDAPASRGRYISHAEVDTLLCQDVPLATDHPEFIRQHEHLEVVQHDIDARVAASMQQGVFLALPQLAHLFALSPLELQTVLVCLGPELHRKYDQLYAYLQDDITRKKPSMDLVLQLLCDTQTERWQARALFSDDAPLFRFGILQATEDPHSPSGSSDLARFLKLDPRILNYLLGNNRIDARFVNIATVYGPSSEVDGAFIAPALKRDLHHFVQHHVSEPKAERQSLVLYFHGPYGVGRRALALEICGALHCPMFSLDMEVLLTHEDVGTLLRLAFREGVLLQAALSLDHADRLLHEDDKSRAILKTLTRVHAEYGWLTFLAGEKRWLPQGVFAHSIFHAVELPLPDVPLRQAVWKKALQRRVLGLDTRWAGQLASQFRLTPGQIRDAVALVEHQSFMSHRQKAVTLADLYAACRSQSNQKLRELAIKIDSRYGWEDIVLPADKIAQLKEICSQVQHRYRVFGEWGFDRKLSHGKGLSALFCGPPGTGKTMAAGVMARALQLDLYKIDLSSVVSKYIGETEKNLANIFREAETSNAILFFDEADALFGKRTEVSDAHDRYANIETSYLLQKMEEYEGMVILATNLRENMDEAFTRRIRFIVEFPFPDAESRLQIWKTHFPPEAPLSDEIDYELLAKKFPIAGGNIKNIVLNAAFLVAENGGMIEMQHILRGTQREYEKIGKLWNEKNVVRPRGEG
jgi:SpoVK/Ycf46/Vps4 family AAA+-type ATPase